MPNSWNLEDGLKLVRAIQPDTRRFGYHLALGGGVLNNGESKKDIDLYFLPLNNPKIAKEDPGALIDWLVKLWGPFEVIGDNYGGEPQDTPPPPITRYFSQPDTDQSNPYRSMFLTDTATDLLPTFAWQSAPIQRPPAARGSYKYKLKFNRGNVERIDVFIL